MAFGIASVVQLTSIFLFFHCGSAPRMQFCLDIWNQGCCHLVAPDSSFFSRVHNGINLRCMVLPTNVQSNSTIAIRRRKIASHELVLSRQLLDACCVFSTCSMEAPIFHVVCFVAVFGESGIGSSAENVCWKLGSSSFNSEIKISNRTHIWSNAAL